MHQPRIKLRQLERGANKSTVQSRMLQCLEVSTSKYARSQFNRRKIMRKSVLFVNMIAIHGFLPCILKTSFPNLTPTLAILKSFPYVLQKRANILPPLGHNMSEKKKHINLLKPAGYMMQLTGLTFNNCTLCPHCIFVFYIYLRTNSDLCHLLHKLIGFYNRDGKCLLRGTN